MSCSVDIFNNWSLWSISWPFSDVTIWKAIRIVYLAFPVYLCFTSHKEAPTYIRPIKIPSILNMYVNSAIGSTWQSTGKDFVYSDLNKNIYEVGKKQSLFITWMLVNSLFNCNMGKEIPDFDYLVMKLK